MVVWHARLVEGLRAFDRPRDLDPCHIASGTVLSYCTRMIPSALSSDYALITG